MPGSETSQASANSKSPPLSLDDKLTQLRDFDEANEAAAFRRAAERRTQVSFAVTFSGLGLLSYSLCAYVLCKHDLGDPGIQTEYYQQVNPAAYQWPMVAFATAFGLNFLTLMFERESAKFQLALLACYINFLAGFTDYLCWRGHAPVMRNVWGQGLHTLRVVMWLHTTPAMVYLLSVISDFKRAQVLKAMACDVLMMLCCLISEFAGSRVMSVLFMMACCGFFAIVVYDMWRMFNAPIKEAQSHSSKVSLHVLRAFTVSLWFIFPLIFFMCRFRLLRDPAVEEWLWCVGDFLGKVLFSSSLLQGNFLTIEQRRLISMRIVEESNRIQVIQELKDLVEQKERFMSSMSHELRTPLNGIMGLSDALLVGSCGEVNEQVCKTITTIKTSGGRLLNLINDILDAASMKKGKLVIKQERVNLRRVVDDVIELCQPLTKRNVKLVNDTSDNIPFVLGDTGRIIQIFHNLIGNSCKFTHQGYIAIGAKALPQFKQVEVWVADTGIGVPDDKFDQIFMAFEQVDMSTTRKYGGTGLGLNLVKQLVEAHGGAISVKSKLGAGTTFTFTLKEFEEAAKPPGSTTGPPDLVHGGSNRRMEASDTGGPRRRGALNRSRSSSMRMLNAAITSAATAATAPVQMAAAALRRAVTSDTGGASQPAVPAAASAVGPPAAAAGAQPPHTAAPVAPPASTAPVNEKVAVLAAKAAGAAAAARARPDNIIGGGLAAAHLGGVGVAGPVTMADAVTLARTIKRRPSMRGRSGKAKVLSVDDDPVNQMVIQNLLAPAGYEIVQAMDGQEALQVIGEMKELPDVILLDVMMPGMSGYEVCRKLREMYPLSCIPVIMISAKSKEEHIVEGLAAGSNDYVVKPFGRQEILARIAAHLRFKDEVYQAGEIAGWEDVAAARASSSDDLDNMWSIESRHHSLPLAFRQELLHSQSRGTIQMYGSIAMACIGLQNLDELLGSVLPEELLKGLTELYKRVDDLLGQHNCYATNVDSDIMVVAGMNGEPPEEQARCVAAFVRSLMAAAEGLVMAGKARFVLTAGLHIAATQAVMVGLAQPVLCFTGVLSQTAAELRALAPPGCAHVSSKIQELLGEDGSGKTCVPAHKSMPSAPDGGSGGGDATYLLRLGQWEQGLKDLGSVAEAYLASSPNGVVNTACRRSKPIQLALRALVEANPHALMELNAHAGLSPHNSSSAERQTPAAPATAPKGADATAAPVGGSGGGPASAARLAHEKEVLERQLEEVSQEADRLQDLVDRLEKDLATAREQGQQAGRQAGLQAQQQVGQEEVERLQRQLQQAQARCAELELQLAELAAQKSSLSAALAEAQGQLRKAQQQVAVAQAAPGNMVISSPVPTAVAATAAVPLLLPSPHQQHGADPCTLRPGSPMQPAAAGFLASYTSSIGAGTFGTNSSWYQVQGQGQGQGAPLLLPSPHQQRIAGLGSAGMPYSAAAGGLHRCRSSLVAGAARPDPPTPMSPYGLPLRSLGPAAPVTASSGTTSSSSPAGARRSERHHDLASLLEELGMEELLPRFQAEDITPALLPYLDDSAMKELGVASIGGRVRLRLAGDALMQQGQARGADHGLLPEI